jgi:hypothetical protein
MEEKKKEEEFDPKAVGEDILKLMKGSFDATFDNVTKIQDLNEKMLRELLEKGEEAQADVVKMMNESIENAKKGRDEYRKTMEDGFKKMEEFLKSQK